MKNYVLKLAAALLALFGLGVAGATGALAQVGTTLPGTSDITDQIGSAQSTGVAIAGAVAVAMIAIAVASLASVVVPALIRKFGRKARAS